MMSRGCVKVRTWRFLKPKHEAWLETMAKKHNLSSPSKAVRICVNCVATDYANHLPWIGSFEHEQSMTFVLSEEQRKEGPAFELAQQQVEWIDSVRYAGSYPDVHLHRALFLCKIIEQCMDMDEYTVFGIIRCKSAISKCKGAQEAVQKVAEQFSKGAGEVEFKEDIDLMTEKERPYGGSG
ncbi:hypothetical protein ACHAWF_007523 [Thalassiosira exigua]